MQLSKIYLSVLLIGAQSQPIREVSAPGFLNVMLALHHLISRFLSVQCLQGLQALPNNLTLVPLGLEKNKTRY